MQPDYRLTFLSRRTALPKTQPTETRSWNMFDGSDAISSSENVTGLLYISGIKFAIFIVTNERRQKTTTDINPLILLF